MNDLYAVSSEYRSNVPTVIENDLILKWYPKRIVERFGNCESLRELGIGHGFTAGIFNESCDRHLLIEGSQVVIDQFRTAHPNFKAELVFGYFDEFETEERFDVIVMGFILEHVEDPGYLLDRYRKVHEHSGHLYVAVPNAKSMNRRLGVELGMIDDIYILNENDYTLGHRRQCCPDSLRAESTRHGYLITDEEGIYLKPLELGVLKTLPDFEANLRGMLQVGIEFQQLCVGLLLEATA